MQSERGENENTSQKQDESGTSQSPNVSICERISDLMSILSAISLHMRNCIVLYQFDQESQSQLNIFIIE